MPLSNREAMVHFDGVTNIFDISNNNNNNLVVMLEAPFRKSHNLNII
jgi:hypothetical protein